MPAIEVRSRPGTRTLVVVVHGFGGVSRNGLITLAKTAFPEADLIAPSYSPGILSSFSNLSPYNIADVLEETINSSYRAQYYDRIVLIGHSLGGELLRKAYLWGAGEEEDRPVHRGKHEWINHVERFVSLASINRGWSIDPSPPNMPWYRRAEYWLGMTIGRLTGTGNLALSVQRGAPFVADSRVQWIRLSRQRGKAGGVPLVIHLLGTHDDVATIKDTKDSQVAKDFKFKSLPDTNHADIATALTTEIGPNGPLTARARTILDCVSLPPSQLSFDEPDLLVEDFRIKRIVFILHGIRDYNVWGQELQRQIMGQLGPESGTIAIVPKYGYFPMAPFLLWSDRQEKVRWFMDRYTEALAQYPQVDQFDFIGHSNGTYILASALQKYRTLKVNDVYFAGSVVPQRYPWTELVTQQRVHRVRNVVATNDWVVAFFPRFYEQVAEWRGRESDPGYLDIGAAGFRGFRDAGNPTSGVRDITFVTGEHSAGVDLHDDVKREVLIRFGQHGLDEEQDRLFDKAFKNAEIPNARTDFWSNVSWLVWLAIVLVVITCGWGMWSLHPAAALVYVGIVVALLNSI